ncbi:hypothetical protein [Candidatus Micrarchaeum sp.]|uniref:hypothetical protein n=1 Tax=Candidatus Micrarchaeum sp. TaxID=2282148 RepID=UPI0019313A9B|nr:hypothetical protein [Candidatus Micrarchaeum sp.]
MTANVVVVPGCPFSISANVPRVIAGVGNFNINYSLSPTVNCTLPSMYGMLRLYNNKRMVYSENLSANVPSSNTIRINTSSLKGGQYSGNLSFANNHTSNFTNVDFTVLSAAKLVISNFRVVGPVNTGSNINMHLILKSEGDYGAGNVILFLNLTSPYIKNLTIPIKNIPAAPASVDIALPSESNLALYAGTYKISAYVEYTDPMVSNKTYTTAPFNTTYIVNAPSHPSKPVKLPAVPIPKIPKITITSAPLYITMNSNSTISTSIGISNPSNSTETLNLSVPGYISNIVKLSTHSLELTPNSNISISVLVDGKNLSSGVYNIPINVSATINNKTSSYTDYATFSVSSSGVNEPVVNTAVELQNNTNDGYVVISISTPSNVTITNGTAITYLPQGLVPNESYMDAYGMPNNITESDGYYYVEWHISKLKPLQTVYAYIYVRKQVSQLLFSGIHTDILAPSVTTPSILHLLYVNSPSFETLGNGTTVVELLYTGAYPSSVNLELTGPPYMHIYNASQSLPALPNQLLYAYFKQTAGNTSGTSIEKLLITAKGAAINYTVPLVINSRPVKITTTTTIAPNIIGTAAEAIKGAVQRYFILLLVIIIAIIITISYYRYINKPHYDRSRSEYIKSMKKRIGKK